jgi:hypothetical protein
MKRKLDAGARRYQETACQAELTRNGESGPNGLQAFFDEFGIAVECPMIAFRFVRGSLNRMRLASPFLS